jgi:hypothetical protein
VSLVKAFLAHKKVKPDGNMSSHIQLCKYKDAIMYGAQQALQLLRRGYYYEIDKFINLFWKETIEAKKEGKLDKQEADPISWSLFNLLGPWTLPIYLSGHTQFSNGIVWQDPSVLAHWAFIISYMARTILCAATMIRKRTK